MKRVDTLLHARWVIPVEPYNVALEHHSIAIADGRIAALLPSVDARREYTAEAEIELPTHTLIPGLVNAHVHLELSWMRGKVAPGDSMPGWAARLMAPSVSGSSVSPSPRKAQTRDLLVSFICLASRYRLNLAW